MSIAEEIYYGKKFAKRRHVETEEEKLYRLSEQYNSLLAQIENVSDAQTYVQMRNAISAHANEVGKNSPDVLRLNSALKNKINDVLEENQDDIEELRTKIQEEQSKHFSESIEALKNLQIKSDDELMKLLMKLNLRRDNKVYMRRELGNYIATANREQAMAVSKLSQMDEYKDVLSQKQRELVYDKATSIEFKKYEQKKQEKIADLNSKLGKLYVKGMLIRKVLKTISNSESEYYFRTDKKNA